MRIILKELQIFSGNRRAVAIETRLHTDGHDELLRTQTKFFRTERGAEKFLDRQAEAETARGVWDKDTSYILGVCWLGLKREPTAHEILELSRLFDESEIQ